LLTLVANSQNPHSFVEVSRINSGGSERCWTIRHQCPCWVWAILNGITIVQPKKKPRRGELIPPEKSTSRHISSIRIRTEHAIGSVKRYRIVKDRIRLFKDGIRDTIMETCCGLHNFRLQYRPWHYAS
jgi:hypothetical protein